MVNTIWILIVLIGFFQPLQSPDQNALWPAIIHDGDSILFVGNSKVGSEGGLHNHFRRMLEQKNPQLNLYTDWISMYGISHLKGMYTDELVERIKYKNDNIVIVSSGSDSAMHKFADLISNSNKQMVVYAIWADNPLINPGGWQGFRDQTVENVHAVRKFEGETGIPVVPSGLIYYDLLVNPVKFKGLRHDYLFVPGSSVQNDLGTLVNVSAIYAVTTGKSPEGLPFWDPFPEKLIHDIQKRVWKIVREWKEDQVVINDIPDITDAKRRKAEKGPPEPALWLPLINDSGRIYYVGNSFIGSEGGLENHFQRMANKMDPPLYLESSSTIFWGQGLNRMYTDQVIENIKTSHFDLVVVTSGPGDMLHKFYRLINEVDSRMMIHMTWGLNPVLNQEGMEGYKSQTERIVEQMLNFEKETGVPIAPCGLVFYDLIVDPPEDYDLRQDWVYMVENIHQNHIGTMANAATHYAVMTGRSPVGMEMWDPYPADLVREVQERAWQIVKDWKSGKINIKNTKR